MSNTPTQRVQALLETAIAEGKERGVQVAAYLDGELIIDLALGHAEPTNSVPVTGETLFPIFSVTKAIAATIIHQQVERGKLDYDQRIAEVWPEFGVNGKEGITIRQALNHSAGLPFMPMGVRLEELADWDHMCARMTELSPAWEPGTKVQYHPITFSWLLGEVARRVDGRPFPQILSEDISQPLGITDLYVGLPDSEASRVAWLEQNEADFGLPVPPDPPAPEPIPAVFGPLNALMNHPAGRRACLPATTGITTARSVARHFAALLPGGVDGVELLPPERIRLATEPQNIDPQGDSAKGWALGYQIGTHTEAFGSPRAFGHLGHGGSAGFADPDRKLAVAYTRNLLNNHALWTRVADEIRAAIA